MSVLLVTIVPDNALLLRWHQAITCGNMGIETTGTNFSGILSKTQRFSFHENAFENIISKMTAIFFYLYVLIYLYPTEHTECN